MTSLRLLLMTLIVPSIYASTLTFKFKRCPAGYVLDTVTSAVVTDTASVRSILDCATWCGQNNDCLSANICRDDQDDVITCDLLDRQSSDGCRGLSVAPVGRTCEYIEKVKPELVCLNNGTSQGTHCACPIQYGGDTCERLIRDCSEAYERGFQSSVYNGVYFIQPVGVKTPFPVRCLFESSGSTYALYRKQQNFNVDYQQAKNGFGDDLTQVPESENFFIGLQNLYYILRQAIYTNTIFMMDHQWSEIGRVHYYNFSIGPESSYYSLTYDSLVEDPAQDGFGNDRPILFSADGFPGAETCAQTTGSPGWYEPGCYSYSPFADNLQWPVNGAVKSINLLNMNLIRESPFQDP